MDTSSDSESELSPGAYNQVAYEAAAAMTGYDDTAIVKSPSRHSESSGSGSDVAEPRGALAHHKFSIDRILGRFSGSDSAAATAIDSCPETSDIGKRHRNELALRGVGEYNLFLRWYFAILSRWCGGYLGFRGDWGMMRHY